MLVRGWFRVKQPWSVCRFLTDKSMLLRNVRGPIGSIGGVLEGVGVLLKKSLFSSKVALFTARLRPNDAESRMKNPRIVSAVADLVRVVRVTPRHLANSREQSPPLHTPKMTVTPPFAPSVRQVWQCWRS